MKLLVEDIRDGRMRSEQIGRQPAGLDAYLKGWWEQVAVAVRAQDVRDLLGSLANGERMICGMLVKPNGL